MNTKLKAIDSLIEQALLEDASRQDITSQTLIPPGQVAQARLIAKEAGMLCGQSLFQRTFFKQDPKIVVEWKLKEGARLRPGRVIAVIRGPARGILGAERVALNFLQRLSGIASLTQKYVEKLRGTRAKLLDTRKTTPGWRSLERHAVKVGGGKNHRFNLADAIMIKDNHRALVPELKKIREKLHRAKRKIPVILEVENLTEIKAALSEGFRYLQLDNMTPSQIQRAVHLAPRNTVFEATGGITLKNIHRVAQTGVQFISVGATTHSAPSLDLSLEFK